MMDGMQDAITPPPIDPDAEDADQSAEFELADVAAFERRTGRADGADRVPRADLGADWLVEVDDTDYLTPRGPAAGRISLGDSAADDDESDRDGSDGDEGDDPDYARELGSRVRPDSAIIRVDGERLNLRTDMVYLAFNKPRGVLSTMADDKGRESIGTYVADRDRLFHVGRLDADSEGLILLTNDGELAHRLTHPRYGVQKTYLAQVAAPVPRNLGRALLRGIELEDGLAKADDYQLLDVSGGRALIQIVLHEGRKHIVRRMLATAGFPVQQLVRTAHGPITLGHLRSGAVRKLSRSELAALYRLVGL
jgi:23S rRNA pseudouridine2605 synthase